MLGPVQTHIFIPKYIWCMYRAVMSMHKYERCLIIGFLSSSEQIGALADQHIVHVACGESHSVALNDQGQLYSWGAGSDGQLGITTTEDSVAIPR